MTRKNLLYHSTRDPKKLRKVTSAEAILEGLAGDGGLYVPEEIPKLKIPMERLGRMTYKEVAYEVMRLFFTDFTEEELKHCINSAYSEENFDRDDMTALVRAGDPFFLELYHGRTIAFKDMALSILPYLMTTSAKKCGITDEIVILTATSGDTGKAALEGFAGVEGCRIAVYYPKGGVSPIQELQMITQTGDNTCVVGVHGNFDDTQTDVKRMFSDPELKEKLKAHGFRFSSANSINIGRLIPQVVYYVYAYTRLLPKSINFVVPTGNFGNILAAHYAAKMGVPVHRLICASNKNKVLYDFFETGVYDRNREFYLTHSPSMDILISSNLERLIYEIAGEKTAKYMDDLKKTGRYELDPKEKEKTGIGRPDLTKDTAGRSADNAANEGLFVPGFADEEDMCAAIKRYYDSEGYVIDPHTAVAAAVYDRYRKDTGDETMTVIASTASPFKFPRIVTESIEGKQKEDDFALLEKLKDLAGTDIPAAVKDVKKAPVRHKTVVERTGMQEALEKFLGI